MTNALDPVAATDARAMTDQAVEWLRHQFNHTSARRFVVALSGGIDSAVVCGLCTRAVGAESVLAAIMPSASNPDDAECARLVAETFEVEIVTIDLTQVAERFYESMPSREVITSALGRGSGEGWRDAESLATANVRPRLRMTTLYYLANLCGGVVVGTGNKSEASVGYFTKYGDGGVDLLPILDFYKFEVRAVAAELGVPARVIARPPSAGLWQGQTDEQELGLSYQELDQTLLAIEQGDTDMVNPSTLERVRTMMSASEHKRSPIPTFHYGRRTRA